MTHRQDVPALAGAVSAATTSLAATLVRRFLERQGRLDIPNHRSSHSHPVPRGGGIAALIGTTVGSLLTPPRLSSRQVLGIGALAGVGWLDDLSGHVPARTRLLTQLLVGATCLTVEPRDRPFAAGVTAGVVNVVNFMDGINGISGLTAIVWGINAVTISDESAGQLLKIGALVTGAGLGFLPHNMPRARIFLGDVGSYAFGGAIASGVLSQTSLKSRYRTAAPMILYAADAGHALYSRTRKGLPLGNPHRDHVYQRLVDIGFSHRQVAIIHAAGAALTSASARLPTPFGICLTTVTTLTYLSLPNLVRTRGAIAAKDALLSTHSPLSSRPTTGESYTSEYLKPN